MRAQQASLKARQRSLFERPEQPLLRWETLSEEVRQEGMQLLTDMFRRLVGAGSGATVGKEVADE